MIKQYIHTSQAKCNFCFQWFTTSSSIKNSLHLCQGCIEKALNTSCYKILSPNGKSSYQLFLFKSNLQLDPHASDESESDCVKSCMLEDIDILRNQQLKKLSQKWSKISIAISNKQGFTRAGKEQYMSVLKDQVKNYSLECVKLQQLLNCKQQQRLAKLGQREDKENQCVLKEREEEESEHALKYSNRKLKKCFNSPEGKKTLMDIGNIQLKKSAVKMAKSKVDSEKGFYRHSNTKSSQLKEDKVKLNPFCCENFDLVTHHLKYSVHGAQKNSLRPVAPRTDEAAQRRQKDLEIIAKDAAKSKIYTYLEEEKAIPPALYLIMTLKIYDALQNTTCLNRCIELISYNMAGIDLKCYLSMLDWACVDVFKLVKVGLTDEHFRTVLSFMADKNVETLVVSSNHLTQKCIFFQKSSLPPKLRNVYLGRNNIQKYKVKDQLKGLQQFLMVHL